MKLTGPAVAKLELPEGKAEAFVWDDDLPGFGLRLRAGGKRTWVVQYRLGTKQRRVSIGTPGALTAEKARKSAAEILAKVRLGQDFQAQKHKVRSEASLTLGAIVSRYIEEYVERRQRARTQTETKRHLEKHWKPLHELPLAGIDRRLVSDRLGRLARDNGPIAANRARAAIGAVYSWAIRAGLAETNPVIGASRPGAETRRSRVLSPAELALIWNATGGPGDYNTIVRLLMLLGQRREEVAGMRRTELRLDAVVWSLPPERTKNGLPHDVPLPAPAVDLIRAVLQRTERDQADEDERPRDLLFGEGRGHFSGWSACKARLDQRILAARLLVAGIDPRKATREQAQARQIPRWVLHDLRRTMVTCMNDELDVPPHIVEAVVNHVTGDAKKGAAGVYNHAKYNRQKLQALEQWARHIGELVESDVSYAC